MRSILAAAGTVKERSIATDQRGFARHADGNNDGTARCDIGAVEGAGGAATFIDFDGDGKNGPSRLPGWRLVRSCVHPMASAWE